jgi:hypothetical protein
MLMKRIKVSIIVALLAMILPLINVTAHEVTEPCLPDCIGDTWTPAFPLPAYETTVLICVYNGITYNAKVRWRMRNACNLWWDYYIEWIGLSEYGIPPCYDPLDQNVPFTVNDITLKFIALNPANFPPLPGPPPGPCENNWRVMKGGCWKFDTSAGGVEDGVPPILNPNGLFYHYDFFLYPCTTSQCCLEYFTVCIVNGVRTITNTGFLPPENCGENPPAWCYPTCGSIYR